MAEAVGRRDPKDLLREAMRLADDYYDLTEAQMQAKLKKQDTALIKQLQVANETLARPALLQRKGEIADERYILERIENLYRTYHKDPNAGPDQSMTQE